MNHVFDVLQLFSRQKLVLFRQGLTSIADLPLHVHKKQDDIRELLKGFNSLTEARGGAVTMQWEDNPGAPARPERNRGAAVA